MKIRKIECVFLYSPFEKKLGNASMWFDGKFANILRVETEEGIIGYGEVYTFVQEKLIEVMKALFPSLIGVTFETWEELGAAIQQKINPDVPVYIRRRIESGFNFAFWDIKGKKENRSVGEYFGEIHKKRIPIYGTGLFYRDVANYKEQLPWFLAEVDQFVQSGYHGIKMKAGRYPVKEEVWLIREVKKNLPSNMKLMVDANCGMKSFDETVALANELEEIGVQWLEEPFLPDDYDSYAALCAGQKRLPIAAGESEYTLEGLKKLCDAGVRIIQPELSLNGGFACLADLIDLKKRYNLQLTPHSWGSGVLYAATLHFYSLLSPDQSLPYEYTFFEDPLRDIFNHTGIKNGYINVPHLPGLGFEVNERELKKFAIVTI